MMTADGSGIECDMVVSSTSNGPILQRCPSGTTCSGKSCRRPASPSFDLSIEAVKGAAYTGRPSSLGQRSTTAPKWSSCAWVRTRPLRFGRSASRKVMSGRITSTPGSLSPPKVMPRSTISLFSVVGRTVAVDVEVHADLAHAAKGDEHRALAFVGRNGGTCSKLRLGDWSRSGEKHVAGGDAALGTIAHQKPERTP